MSQDLGTTENRTCPCLQEEPGSPESHSQAVEQQGHRPLTASSKPTCGQFVGRSP